MKKTFILLFSLFFVLSSCAFSSSHRNFVVNKTNTLSSSEALSVSSSSLLCATSTKDFNKFLTLNNISVPLPSLPNEELTTLLKERLEAFTKNLDLPFSITSLDYYSFEEYNTKTFTFYVPDTVDTFNSIRLYFSYDTLALREKSVYDLIDRKSLSSFLTQKYGVSELTVDAIEIVQEGVNIYSGEESYFVNDEYFTFEKNINVFYPQSYLPVVDTDEKYIAITFDDGPNPYTTVPLLEILKENDVKATFFMVGYNIEEYPYVVKKVFADGHDIGIHSYKHSNYGLMKFEDVINDIDKCANLVYSAVGKKPYLVRPPFGSIKEEDINTDDYFFVNWNVDPCDWKLDSPEEIANEVLKFAKSGSIILMHDIYESSYKAAEIVIKKLKNDGYRFVTISEYFDLHGNKTDNKLHFFLEDYNVKKS